MLTVFFLSVSNISVSVPECLFNIIGTLLGITNGTGFCFMLYFDVRAYGFMVYFLVHVCIALFALSVPC